MLDSGLDHPSNYSVEPSTPEGDLAVNNTDLCSDAIAGGDDLHDVDRPALRVGAIHCQEVATVESFAGLGELNMQTRREQLVGAIPVTCLHPLEEGPNHITRCTHQTDDTDGGLTPALAERSASPAGLDAFVLEYPVGDPDAIVADRAMVAEDELRHLILRLTAERAA